MPSPAHSRNPSGGVRSRRSYPSLQHISLAPLSTKFPVDDDSTGPDYFSTSHGETRTPNHIITSSYLASSSVPTTPGVLSDVQHVSHTTNPKRKKVSTTGVQTPASETHLDELNARGPLHHHSPHHYSHHRRGPTSQTSRPRTAESQDNEWLMRAGLALSSSAREEKGQSWLVKRDSSTSLVTTVHDERVPYAKRNQSATRRTRSGVSTPLMLSRRPSSSYSGNRRTSRLDLRMTAREVDAEFERDHRDIEPDFVDEAIRNQMAAYATGARDRDMVYNSRRGSVFIPSDSSDVDSISDSSDENEFDEDEMQRLTRQRGFGLGSWIDSLVEWTLFSVQDDIPSGGAEAAQTRRTSLAMPQEDVTGANVDSDSDGSETETEEHQKPTQLEPAGDRGGWADVGWFLRVAIQAL